MPLSSVRSAFSEKKLDSVSSFFSLAVANHLSWTRVRSAFLKRSTSSNGNTEWESESFGFQHFFDFLHIYLQEPSVSIVSKSNLSPLKHDRRSNASWREHVFVDVSNGRYYCRICVTATDICNSTLTLKGWAGNARSSTAIIKHVQKEHDQKLPLVRTRAILKSVQTPSSLSRKDMLDQLMGAAIATSSITPWTLENDYFKNWVH